MHPLRLLVALPLGLYGLALFFVLLPLIGGEIIGVWSFAGRLVQCVFALLAAFAVLTNRGWAPFAIVATGVAVAITVLGDAFVVGITAPLYALLIAVLAIVCAVLLAWLFVYSQRMAEPRSGP